MKREQVPEGVSVVDASGMSTGRHVAALSSTPKHFTKDRISKAKLPTGITMEYSIEGNADAESAACRYLPEVRVVMIIGFLQTKEMWAPVIDMLMSKWDARRQGQNLKVLTMDNRGAGGSDVPWGRYTTSQMAQDTLSLLDHVGWDAAHIVGISMGGMISMEMACAAPERMLSLSLLVSTRGRYVPDPRSFAPLLGAMFSRTPNTVMRYMLSLLYPRTFLRHPIKGRDNELVRNVLGKFYETVSTRQGPPGLQALFGQGMAVQTHYISDERLDTLAKAGFPVLIVGSMKDILIPPEETVKLTQRLGGDQVKAFFFQEGGHGIETQFPEELADGLANTFQRSRL